MSYSKKINPILKLCPVCGKRLTYGTMQSGIKTSCKCGFEEASGSLYILQYLGDVMTEYTQLKGITHLHGVGNDKYTVAKGFALGGYGYLPTLQQRNISMTFGSTSQSSLFQGSEVFGVVASEKGVIGERLCVNPHGHSPAELKHLLVNQIISLTYVVDETMNLSQQSSEKRSGNTLYMQDVNSIKELIAKNAASNAQQSPSPSNHSDIESDSMEMR